MTIQILFPKRRMERGDTAAVLAAANEILLDKEWCIETDTGRFKSGDGVTAWLDLPYVGAGEIDLTGLADGDALLWDAASETWIPGPAGGGSSAAIDVTYDPTASGLTATNVQDALDEIVAANTGYAATSTTSLVTAGSGSKVFTTQAGLSYTPGARIRATSAGTGEWMEGVVTAYSGTTLTVTMDLNSGTGTHADWDINIAGERGTIGPSTKFVIPLCDSTQSTKFDLPKLALGRKYFDPNDAGWNLTGTSVATLYMVLETTHASFTAAGDLFQQTGTGSPATVATITPTASTTATLVSVDVSAAFQPGANAGIFSARTWITTADGTQQATCSGAWIEIQP